MGSGRCGFVYDPPGRPPPGADPDGRWRCPRDPAEGGDRCPFHRPPGRPADFDAADALREAVVADAPVRLYGASLADVDLGRLRLDGPGSDRGVRLDAARIDGSVRLTESAVDCPVSLRTATVAGDVDAAGIEATALVLDGAQVDGDLRVDDGDLGRLGLAETTVVGDASLVDAAVERLAGLAFSLPVAAAALRRVLLYSRSRADSESYGGLVAWLLGR